MYNDLFSIGPITVHGYGLMIAIGIVMALVLAIVRSKSHRMSRDHAINILIICLIFGFLGAKLLYCIVEWEMFVQNPLSALSGGGFVVYGGIITGMISTIIYCHIKKISFLKYFDLMIPCVSIAQGFGRVGKRKGAVGRQGIHKLLDHDAVCLERRAEADDVAPEAGDGVGQYAEHVGGDVVVTVDEDQILALRRLDADVARLTHTAVRLVDGADALRVRRSIAVADRAALAVGRAVVGDI